MNPERAEIHEVTKKIVQQILAGGEVWLFLDYDGTLADFAPSPDDILPDPELIKLLRRLSDCRNMHVSIISGRRIEHIQALLPAPGLLLAGAYGIELQAEDGKIIQQLEYKSTRAAIEPLKPRWQALIEGKQGFYLEDKGWSLALHARFANEQEAANVLSQALQAAGEAGGLNNFRMLGSDRFLEVSPAQVDKGRTVAYILDHYASQHFLAVYVGDDDKDEKAFHVIHERGGIAVLVSPTRQLTQALYRLSGPADVRVWLEEIIQRVQSATQ